MSTVKPPAADDSWGKKVARTLEQIKGHVDRREKIPVFLPRRLEREIAGHNATIPRRRAQ